MNLNLIIIYQKRKNIDSFYITKIDDNLYKAFAKTARKFAENYSRRNDVILNCPSVHRILKQGVEETKSQDVKRKIKQVIEYTKRR